ncbi:glycosyltransferase family 4 protein [Polaribacter sp. HL-MS24]|uniref:glycosyltransferase family 4 protein n=1 Tax=Polaribacter sp. HL-MS24 TaxID=3077735 RepID=UPI002934D937|nr:glycosyltransferase family 4 protein [Polaribacter sp. HL-MS24]WOC39247.1 glycosyltransferase family 4 protein [Polaribacter sp. HL-MS24]
MNNKKKILIVSPFFYPEPISTGKFNTDLVRSLSEKGHEVTVLCFHPFYPSWKSIKSNEQIEGVTIIRGGNTLIYPKKTIFRRMVLEVGFAFFVLKKLRKVQKNKDIIMPVFPPSLAFYLLLPFLNREVRKVGMIHDLQEIYSSNKKGLLNKGVKYFIHKIEKKCFNFCDKLIFLSNEMKEAAVELYQLDPIKSAVQYPFITLKNTITNQLTTVLKPENTNVVYSGALGEKQNPTGLYNFFNYASEIIENGVFHFFSQGEVFNQLKEENKNPKILFHDLVPKENLEELYQKSDVQILPQLSNTSRGSLPSKLPNILASGCKILVITDKNSEIENLFLSKNLHTAINSWDNEIILEALQQLLISNSKDHNQIKVASEIFTIDRLIQEILI